MEIVTVTRLRVIVTTLLEAVTSQKHHRLLQPANAATKELGLVVDLLSHAGIIPAAIADVQINLNLLVCLEGVIVGATAEEDGDDDGDGFNDGDGNSDGDGDNGGDEEDGGERNKVIA